MARITVTTDEGEVIETWTDAEDEDGQIGNLSRPLNRQRMNEEIADAVRRARAAEGRKDPETGSKL